MQWEPRVLAGGLRYPEGPVALGDGRIAFTEVGAGVVSVWDGASTTVLAKTGGAPNGAARAPDGSLWVANNGGIFVGPEGYWHSPDPIAGRVQRIADDGRVEDVVTEFPDSEPPNRPNDIVFGPDARAYVTDPANWEDLKNLRPGRVWRCTQGMPAEQVAEVPMFPNGLAFTRDARSLLVAQSIAMKLLELPRAGDSFGEAREFCSLPKGFPDGFCIAADGDVYVCGSMGDTICVFDDEGTLKHVTEAPAGTEPTNCCIDAGVLYVTCSGTGELVAFDLGIEPLAPPNA